MPLRVALFVEGSLEERDRRGRSYLERIWNETLPKLAPCGVFSRVVGINKKHLLSMDPAQPKMSGAEEPLDALIARELKRAEFDAAVVAWDLHPKWNPGGTYCRWEETVALYRFLAKSVHLRPEWLAYAKAREAELVARATPAQRPRPPQIVRGAVLPLCMEPMFEALLVRDEQALRSALGAGGQRVPRWPGNWSRPGVYEPDVELMGKAILAVRDAVPDAPMVRRIRKPMREAKNEWDHALLAEMSAKEAWCVAIRQHPTVARLREVALPP